MPALRRAGGSSAKKAAPRTTVRGAKSRARRSWRRRGSGQSPRLTHQHPCAERGQAGRPSLQRAGRMKPRQLCGRRPGTARCPCLAQEEMALNRPHLDLPSSHTLHQCVWAEVSVNGNYIACKTEGGKEGSSRPRREGGCGCGGAGAAAGVSTLLKPWLCPWLARSHANPAPDHRQHQPKPRGAAGPSRLTRVVLTAPRSAPGSCAGPPSQRGQAADRQRLGRAPGGWGRKAPAPQVPLQLPGARPLERDTKRGAGSSAPL